MAVDEEKKMDLAGRLLPALDEASLMARACGEEHRFTFDGRDGS